MKVVLLLALVLVGAYAQTVTNWDLSEISPDSGIVEADKKPEFTGRDRKASNQGYTARYTQQGKTLKMSLTVQKETSVRVTDTDRLLFGMEGASNNLEVAMANMTLSYGETAAICESALGDTWETMVHLPTEDLTYVEALRLATSLNEYTLLAHGNGGKGARDPPGDFDCLCHGTAHHFQLESQGHSSTENPNFGGEFKRNGPFWGVRILGRLQKGHGYQGASAHIDMPYADRDCMLCDHALGAVNPWDTQDIADGFEYDCRWCCFGKCVVTPPASGDASTNGVDFCDLDYRFDDGAPGTESDTNSLHFNYYRINDVGSCRLPRTYYCEEEVERWCVDCDTYITNLFDTDSDDVLEDCDYCDLVVGANQYICPNCSFTLDAIETYGTTPGFREGGECNCSQAFWQIAFSDVDTQRRVDWRETNDEEGDEEGTEGVSADSFKSWSN